jgi:hypothetical protein
LKGFLRLDLQPVQLIFPTSITDKTIHQPSKDIVTLKLCKFQITGYNSNRYHFMYVYMYLLGILYSCVHRVFEFLFQYYSCRSRSSSKNKIRVKSKSIGIVGRTTTRIATQSRMVLATGADGEKPDPAPCEIEICCGDRRGCDRWEKILDNSIKGRRQRFNFNLFYFLNM